MTITNDRVEQPIDETEVEVSQDNLAVARSRVELDQQVATARAYPRSLKRFREECMSMATLTEEIASECFYALPRDGKTIEGPSTRLAEIVASSWGNCRAGARVVDESAEFITAQGVFQDLERNVHVTMEVRRRITGKGGRRYSADMIAVTGNAACSVALRNAVFRGVPKALWTDIYQAARKASVGDIKTIANRRAEALAYLQKMGVTQEMVFATLEVAGVDDIGQEQLCTLKGLVTAIKEGDTTVDEAFARPAPKTETAKAKGVEGLAARVAGTREHDEAARTKGATEKPKDEPKPAPKKEPEPAKPAPTAAKQPATTDAQAAKALASNIPVNEDTVVYTPDEEVPPKPATGSLRYDGPLMGCSQWTGTAWIVVAEQEPAHDQARYWFRKRITKWARGNGLDATMAREAVAAALEVKVPSTLGELTIDQLCEFVSTTDGC